MSDSAASVAAPALFAAAEPTFVAKTRGIPLGKVTDTAAAGLRRIVPAAETPKPPVAAFDSAL